MDDAVTVTVSLSVGKLKERKRAGNRNKIGGRRKLLFIVKPNNSTRLPSFHVSQIAIAKAREN